ncbi:MAG: THUMP domain-containing protein [Paludibacter sp.]|nr:THUMP domain-containing protein [Paludibacter sp.]
MQTEREFEMIAKTFKGLEEVLAAELLNLGANNIEIQRRAVSFTGNKGLLYRSNMFLRTASRVLKPFFHFRAKDADQVYEELKKVRWSDFLDVQSTFAVDTTIYSENFKHSKFVAYRVKDAIVDWFTEREKERPSVRLDNPNMLFHLHIANDRCTLSVDSSGDSLHKRGYRISQNEAPINEALAAGMLLLAGWDGQTNFVDPMCGSGTLLIEAALIALNIPPGLYRSSFAFEKWPDFDKDLFDDIYNDDSEEREFKYKIYGSDISKRAISISEQNIKSAGLNKYIELQQVSIKDLNTPVENCMLVTNPPYGERITSDDLLGLYADLGTLFKHQFAGNSCWVISSHKECLDKIGLKPTKKYDLLNGTLECKFNQYEIFSGKRKTYVVEKQNV